MEPAILEGYTIYGSMVNNTIYHKNHPKSMDLWYTSSMNPTSMDQTHLVNAQRFICLEIFLCKKQTPQTTKIKQNASRRGRGFYCPTKDLPNEAKQH